MKEKKGFDFSRLLNNNTFIRILSIIIAVIAWLVVSITIDDKQASTVPNVPLTLNYANSVPDENGLKLIDGGEQLLTIKVEGIRIEIGGLQPDDLIATPDFSQVTEPGEHEVPVSVTRADPNSSFNIVDRKVKVKMTFDRMETRTFELTAVADNVTAEEGYRKDRVTASPGKLDISGPKTELALIDHCVVRYDGTEIATDTLIKEGTLVFYDQEGNVLDQELQLSHITYTESTFSVNVPILMTKTVPVKALFTNGDGKEAALQYTLSVDQIAIAGRRSVIEDINEVQLLPAINFSEIDAGSVFTRDVTLDAGVYNEDNIEQITITIDPDAYEQTTMDIGKSFIILRNQPTDMKVTVTSNGINNVKIVGSKEDIAILQASELYAIVDVHGIKEGTTSVPVIIQSTGNKYVWAVGEYNVKVKATMK